MQTSMQTQLRAPKAAHAFASRPQRRSIASRSAMVTRSLKVSLEIELQYLPHANSAPQVQYMQEAQIAHHLCVAGR